MSMETTHAAWFGAEESGPRKATTSPATTVGSLVAVKYNGGVAVLADKTGSYGKWARYNGISRVFALGPSTIIAVSGDVADFQLVESRLQQILRARQALHANADFPPSEVAAWLTAVLYNRRSRMNPLWNSALVLGVAAPKDVIGIRSGDKTETFLGQVDMRGVPNEGDVITTGFATHLCRQMLETSVNAAKGGLSETEAIDLLRRCQDILYHRDCQAGCQFDIGIVDSEGPRMVENQSTKGNWAYAQLTLGYE